jgi:hypothetical protein
VRDIPATRAARELQHTHTHPRETFLLYQKRCEGIFQRNKKKGRFLSEVFSVGGAIYYWMTNWKHIRFQDIDFFCVASRLLTFIPFSFFMFNFFYLLKVFAQEKIPGGNFFLVASLLIKLPVLEQSFHFWGKRDVGSETGVVP